MSYRKIELWSKVQSVNQLIWIAGSLILYNPGLRIAVVAEKPLRVMAAIEENLCDVCIVKRFGATARVKGAKRTIRVLQRHELKVTDDTFNYFIYLGKGTDLHWRCLELRAHRLHWKNQAMVQRVRIELAKLNQK